MDTGYVCHGETLVWQAGARLFELRQSPNVKKLILQQDCKPGWERTSEGFEALSTELKFNAWRQACRVVLVRRRLQNAIVIAPDTRKVLPQQLSLLEPAENMAAYENTAYWSLR